jgi:hypothetical protein
VNAAEAQSSIYVDVIREARRRGIEFAVGGGTAVATYTIFRQSTKDLDLYVTPENRGRIIEVLGHCGLRDYFDVREYDRKWIYRAHWNDCIVDVMWAMPNQRTQVDLEWLRRGPEIELYGERVRILAPEELIWAKLYIIQRDRSDWPDVLNLIYATGPQLDWDHLISRLGDDAPLLGAALIIFRWLSPDRARNLPDGICERLSNCITPQRGIPRDRLLDTRPWFVPSLEHAARRS